MHDLITSQNLNCYEFAIIKLFRFDNICKDTFATFWDNPVVRPKNLAYANFEVILFVIAFNVSNLAIFVLSSANELFNTITEHITFRVTRFFFVV